MKYTIKGGVKGPDQYTQKTTTGRKKATGPTKINKTQKYTGLKNPNLPKTGYIVKTREATYSKTLSNPKPHKPVNHESNNSEVSDISNTNSVQESLYNGVLYTEKNRFNINMLKKQKDKCRKNAEIKNAPRASYTYVLGEKDNKYIIWICRPYSKQEITTLHVNIVEMMKIHKDHVIIAGEMQIINRCDLDGFKKKSEINVNNVKKPNGEQKDKLYLFNFESGTFSAPKLNKLSEPGKQTAINNFVGIVKNTLSQYDIPEENIIYTKSTILAQKRIYTSRKKMGILRKIMRKKHIKSSKAIPR